MIRCSNYDSFCQICMFFRDFKKKLDLFDELFKKTKIIKNTLATLIPNVKNYKKKNLFFKHFDHLRRYETIKVSVQLQ